MCSCEAGKVGYNSHKMLYTVSLSHSGKALRTFWQTFKAGKYGIYKRKILLSGLWFLYWAKSCKWLIHNLMRMEDSCPCFSIYQSMFNSQNYFTGTTSNFSNFSNLLFNHPSQQIAKQQTSRTESKLPGSAIQDMSKHPEKSKDAPPMQKQYKHLQPRAWYLQKGETSSACDKKCMHFQCISCMPLGSGTEHVSNHLLYT